MASIMQERRREHLNTPHLASASGSIASFQTDMRANLEEIKIHFNPVQSGTGTPSPTNVRPLSGWTGCDIYISPTQDASQGNQIPVSWSDDAGIIHGGWTNPFTGEGMDEYYYGEFRWGDRLYPATLTNTVRGSFRLASANSYIEDSVSVGKYCNMLPFLYDYTNDWPHYYSSNQNGRIYMFLPIGTSDDTIIQVAIKRATPVPFSFTPISPVKSLIGQNNIWANTNGNVDVRYWKH